MSKQIINRTEYKRIKKYDHQQMEQFLMKFYENGYRDGAKAAVGNVTLDLDRMKQVLLTVRGIGEGKATDIIKVFKGITE